MQEPPELFLGFGCVTRKTRTLFNYPAIHNTNMENLLDFVPKFYFSDGFSDKSTTNCTFFESYSRFDTIKYFSNRKAVEVFVNNDVD